MRRALFGCLVASLSGASPTEGAIRSLSLESLLARSDDVVVGRVVDVRSRWSTMPGVGRLIVTDVAVVVEEALLSREAVGRRMEIVVPGETVGDIRREKKTLARVYTLINQKEPKVKGKKAKNQN